MWKSEAEKSFRSENAIGVCIKNALGGCKSEAERSESAIGVLKNVLGRCKSEAERSESATGVYAPQFSCSSQLPPFKRHNTAK